MPRVITETFTKSVTAEKRRERPSVTKSIMLKLSPDRVTFDTPLSRVSEPLPPPRPWRVAKVSDTPKLTDINVMQHFCPRSKSGHIHELRLQLIMLRNAIKSRLNFRPNKILSKIHRRTFLNRQYYQMYCIVTLLTGASSGLIMWGQWGGQQGEPLKWVWRRYPHRGPGDPGQGVKLRVARCPVLNRTVRFWGDLPG